MENKCDITFNGDESLSYFANGKSLCWFLESKLEEQIKRLHNVVGNAIIDDHYIVVALYALSPTDQLEPISVVSTTPFYLSYPEVTNFVKLGLHKWTGDAKTFEKNRPYIEFITSPNNPDGVIREPVVNGDQGKLIYDLAYYCPQYTAITSIANHDIMLFTVFKCTGQSGSRIGWALVKDKEVARKMTNFMDISTIGVSKEAQFRAAKILEVVSDSCLEPKMENFFEYSYDIYLKFFSFLLNLKFILFFETTFAWLICKGGDKEDCEKLLKEHKIHTRSGSRFGSDSRNIRISMLSRDEDFNIFLKRLLAFQGSTNRN
ncbi:hypothetical protein R3W88_026968 [Solanum pinnatisectum]|uniref:Alliinase C-terminal domain-containing protein n=1 Tax=Solanum pinnatisectum TaxID=50273 RepID=A0AAV9LHF7_9SOLN|nr:hypothetical protein R3W88_026968 [Solanum pinnatisectum]